MFIPRFTNHTEKLAAKVSIPEHRVKEVESVLGARRHHESDKRAVLRNQTVYTLSEIVHAVKDSEKATAKRKKPAPKRIHRRQKIVAREVVSSDDSEDQSDKELEPDDEAIRDCTRVRDHK